jgi:hypothetical protein
MSYRQDPTGLAFFLRFTFTIIIVSFMVFEYFMAVHGKGNSYLVAVSTMLFLCTIGLMRHLRQRDRNSSSTGAPSDSESGPIGE